MKGSYEDSVDQLDQNELEALNKVVNEILNTYTLLALHIKNHVLDEKLAYQRLAHKFVRFFRWCEGYIVDVRNKSNERFLFIDYEHLILDWEEQKLLNARRYKESQERARNHKRKL